MFDNWKLAKFIDSNEINIHNHVDNQFIRTSDYNIFDS